MTLKDKDVAEAFDADVPILQFPTECTPEVRESIDNLAALQRETTDAISRIEGSILESHNDLREVLKNSDTRLRNHLNAVAANITQAISKLKTAIEASTSAKPAAAFKWYKKPWLWSLSFAIPTLIIYMAAIWIHAGNYDATPIDTLEQVILSDDYADYLHQRDLQRHLCDTTLSAFGLTPLPAPEVAAPSLDTQCQYHTSLRAWHTHLSEINTRYLIALLISLAIPYWLSLFPHKK